MHSISSHGPKACITCAKAKSRCIPGPTGENCERCHRLKKPCSAQMPAPPRKRKAPKPTRVAELEKRLEDLTARVESRQPRPLTGATGDSVFDIEGPQRNVRRSSFRDSRAVQQRPGYSHIFAPDSPDYHDQHRDKVLSQQLQPSPQCDENTTHVEEIDARRAAANTIRGGNGISPRTTSQSQRSRTAADPNSSSSFTISTASGSGKLQQQEAGHQLFKDTPWQKSFWLGGSSLEPGASETGDPWYYPSTDEAQYFLESNTHSVPLFPFVVIPPNITSEVLRRDRPLLWKAAMVQALQLDARRQVSMGDDLLKEIVATAFIQSQKSVDLLLALEILVAWSHLSAKSFQLTNFLFLMRSLCVSLGFNESQESSKGLGHDLASLEQMRAFTGVYYLVTMVFTTSKKPDAFMNTAYLGHCCHILQERMEYPTDQLVVLLVRTQQLSQSISMTLAFRQNRDSLPMSLIIQNFEHEIHQLRNTVPENLRTNVTLKAQMHIAEILLYEAGLHEGLSAGSAATDRLELLWKCLSATKSMLEARFQRKFEGWPRWISLTSFDYTYAMLVCLKLSLLQLPGWDLRVVRKELNFDEYLMIQIVDLRNFTAHRAKPHSAKTEGVSTEGTPGLPEFQDPFVRLHTRLAQLRLSILAELSASLPPDTQQPKDTNAPPHDSNSVDGAVAATGSSMAAVFGETLSSDLMQGLNDPNWQDLYKSSEWEASFSELFGWGSDDRAASIYVNWTGDGPSY